MWHVRVNNHGENFDLPAEPYSPREKKTELGRS